MKQFEEETSLRAYLLVDMSESMGWSSNPNVQVSKLWYAKHLAASLALILLRQGDAVGMAAFHDQVADRVRCAAAVVSSMKLPNTSRVLMQKVEPPLKVYYVKWLSAYTAADW